MAKKGLERRLGGKEHALLFPGTQVQCPEFTLELLFQVFHLFFLSADTVLTCAIP